MTLVFELLPFGLSSQRLYEIKIQGCVDTAALVLQPELLSILFNQLLHYCRFQDYLLFSGFWRGQAQFDFASVEELI